MSNCNKYCECATMADCCFDEINQEIKDLKKIISLMPSNLSCNDVHHSSKDMHGHEVTVCPVVARIIKLKLKAGI